MLNQLAIKSIVNRLFAIGKVADIRESRLIANPFLAYCQLSIAFMLNKGPPRKRQPDLHFMKQSGSYPRLLLRGKD
jgi:hypothetical protein